jgi:hypothetical protein
MNVPFTSKKKKGRHNFEKLVSLSCLNVLVVGVLCPEGREVEKEGKASLWRAASWLAGGRGPDREVRASRPASVRPRFGEDSDKSSWK